MSDNQFLIEMGKRISQRRKDLQMTQEQVAEKMNLSLQSISCIELGKKAIRPENLLNLCRTLNVTADYVLTGDKSAKQLSGIFRKLATLSDDDFHMVESLVDHLNKKR